MTILVTGARGHVGRAVLDALVAAGQDVRATSRDATTLDVPDGVTKVSADLEDPSTLDTALDGVRSVFLYVRPQGIEGFVKAAEAAGVRHVVLLSSGATLEPKSARSRIAILHRAVEEALIGAPFAETLLNPGSFATNALGWRADVAEGVVRTPYPDSRVGAIHERDIGDVAAKILADGSHAGQALAAERAVADFVPRAGGGARGRAGPAAAGRGADAGAGGVPDDGAGLAARGAAGGPAGDGAHDPGAVGGHGRRPRSDRGGAEDLPAVGGGPPRRLRLTNRHFHVKVPEPVS